MEPKPKISVLLPLFNHADLIGRTLDTLAAQETDVPFEVVVCNDGSTDAGLVAVRSWQLSQKDDVPFDLVILSADRNSGSPAAPINAAAAYARGSLWTWVSADNEYHPRFLSVLTALLEGGDVGFAYSGFEYAFEGGSRTLHYTPWAWGKLLESPDCFIGSCFLVRAAVWRAAGPHRAGPAHDYDHWLRIEEVCRKRGLDVASTPEALGVYWAHYNRVCARTPPRADAEKWRQEALRRRGMA